MSEKDPYAFYKKKGHHTDQPRKTYQDILKEVETTVHPPKRETQTIGHVEKNVKPNPIPIKKPEDAPVKFTDIIIPEPRKTEPPPVRETFGNKELKVEEEDQVNVSKSQTKGSMILDKGTRSMGSLNPITPLGDVSPQAIGDEEPENFEEIVINKEQETTKKKGRKVNAGVEEAVIVPEPEVSKITHNDQNPTPLEDRSIVVLDMEVIIREKIDDLLKALDEGAGLLQVIQNDFVSFKQRKVKLFLELENNMENLAKVQNSEKVSEEGALQKSVNAFLRIVNEYENLGKEAEYQATLLHNQILSEAKGNIPDIDVYIASLLIKISSQKATLQEDLESLDKITPKTQEAQEAAQKLNELLNTDRLSIEALRDKVNLVLCQLIKEYSYFYQDIMQKVADFRAKVSNLNEIERYIKNAQLQEKNIKDVEQAIKVILQSLDGIFTIPTSNYTPGVLGLTKQASVLTKIESIEEHIKSKKELIRSLKIQTKAVFDPSTSDGSHAKLKYNLMDSLETKLKGVEKYHAQALETCRGLKEIFHIEKKLLNLYNEKNYLKNHLGEVQATYEPVFNLIKSAQNLKFTSDRGDLSKEETSKKVEEYYKQLNYAKSELLKMAQVLDKIHDSKDSKSFLGPPLEYTKDRISKEIKTLDEWSYIIFQLKLKNNDTEGQLSSIDVNTFLKNYQGFCEDVMSNKLYRPISSFEKLQEKVIFLKSNCRKKISELNELASQTIQQEVARKIKKNLTALSNIDEDVRIIDDCIHLCQRTYNISQYLKKEALDMFTPETGYKGNLQEEYNFVTQSLNIFNKFSSREDREKSDLVQEILKYYTPQLAIISKIYTTTIELFFKKVPQMNSSMTEQLEELITEFTDSTGKVLANIKETEVKRNLEDCLPSWKKAAYAKISETGLSPTSKIYKSKVSAYIGALMETGTIYKIYNFKTVRGDLIEIRKKYNEAEKTAFEIIIEAFENMNILFFYNTFDITSLQIPGESQRAKWIDGVQTFKAALNTADSCMDFSRKEKFDFFKNNLRECMSGVVSIYEALASRFHDFKKKIAGNNFSDLIEFLVEYTKLVSEANKKLQKNDPDYAKVYKFEIMEGPLTIENFYTSRFSISKSHFNDVADLLAMDIEFKAMIKKPINNFPKDVTLDFPAFYQKLDEMKKLLGKMKVENSKFFLKMTELSKLFDAFSNELDDSETFTKEIENATEKEFKPMEVDAAYKKVKQLYGKSNFQSIKLLFDYLELKIKSLVNKQ